MTRPSAEVRCLGAGAALALARDGSGVVLQRFAKAAYLRLPGGLLALTAPGTHPGPLHARLGERLPRLAAGSPVRLRDRRLELGEGLVVELAGARRWTGEQPSPAALKAARGGAGRALAGVGSRSALLSEPYASAAGNWPAMVEAGALEELADRLGGLGPGLTPAGDDALAGVLLVARLLWGVAAEPRLLGYAGRARSSELSLSFLAWAARGQSLAPAHDLLGAACRGRWDQVEGCARVLGSVGASSGADLCLGIRTALERLPVR